MFCMDREINSTDDAVSQILSDNYSGCVAGPALCEAGGRAGNYVELLGLVGDNNTWNRSKGFHSVVDRYPDLKMVGPGKTPTSIAKALEATEAILQGNPNRRHLLRQRRDGHGVDQGPSRPVRTTR